MATEETQLGERIEPIVRALGFKVWGVEYLMHSHPPLLRIYIDGPNGIKANDCAQVTRQLHALFAVEDPLLDRYVLEVSSPGLNRRLFRLEQYADYKDQAIKLELRQSMEGRRQFSGQLGDIKGSDIVVLVDDKAYTIPFAVVAKATVYL